MQLLLHRVLPTTETPKLGASSRIRCLLGNQKQVKETWLVWQPVRWTSYQMEKVYVYT
jgi:hypothetical protein